MIKDWLGGLILLKQGWNVKKDEREDDPAKLFVTLVWPLVVVGVVSLLV